MTIEGLGSPERPDPLQAAFIAEQAAQCGYCTAGIVMTARALLDRKPRPSEKQVRQALAGNLCRCGSHARVLRAVMRAAAAKPGGAEHDARAISRRSSSPRAACWWSASGSVGSAAPAAQTIPDADRFLGKPLAPDQVDSFLAIHRDGSVTLFTGKVDIGTGGRIAMRQMVAEELDIPLERIALIEGDTALTPDQGATAGSYGIARGGMQLRQAAATARQALLALAAQRLGRPVGDLEVADGVVRVKGGGASVSYGELIGDQALGPGGGSEGAAEGPSRASGSSATRCPGPTSRPRSPAATATSTTWCCRGCSTRG